MFHGAQFSLPVKRHGQYIYWPCKHPSFPLFAASWPHVAAALPTKYAKPPWPNWSTTWRVSFPTYLLSQEDQGPNSRERIFSLALTFECFLWQVLKPKTACRESFGKFRPFFALKTWAPLMKTPVLIAKLADAYPKNAWSASSRLLRPLPTNGLAAEDNWLAGRLR